MEMKVLFTTQLYTRVFSCYLPTINIVSSTSREPIAFLPPLGIYKIVWNAPSLLWKTAGEIYWSILCYNST